MRCRGVSVSRRLGMLLDRRHLAVYAMVALGLVARFGVRDARAAGSFGRPGVLNSNASTDSLPDFSATAASDGGANWVAMWDARASIGDVSIKDVYFARSTDGAVSWSDRAPLYSEASGLNGAVPFVASNGADTFVAVADALPPHGIYVSRSADMGANWAAPIQISTVGNGKPHLATDGTGVWVAAWGTQFPGAGDDHIRFARSADNAVSWSSDAVMVAGDDTDGRYGDDPRLATDRAGIWVVAWLVAFNGLRISRSTDNGQTWGAAYPVLAPSETGEDNLDVATDGAGTWVVVWSAVTPADDSYDIYWIRSTDNGVTWSAAAPLYPDYATDPPSAKYDPRVIYTSSGAWLVVWQSDRNLGGATGSDGDTHIARSFDGGATWTAPALMEPRGAHDGPEISKDAEAVHNLCGAGIGPSSERIAVGISNNTMNGTVGNDGDIFFSIDRDRCPLTPASGCLTPTVPGASRLMLKDSAGGKDQLTWKWKSGQATTLADLGDPALATNYALCLYDNVPAGMRAVLEKDAVAGLDCGAEPCWSAASGGYRYRDKDSEQGAIRNLSIVPGEAGRARLDLRAAGPTLSLPIMPLAKNPNVRVQLLNTENGKCWEATFSTALKNDATRFKARSD